MITFGFDVSDCLIFLPAQETAFGKKMAGAAAPTIFKKLRRLNVDIIFPYLIKIRTFACRSERSEESLISGVETLRYRSGRHGKAKLSESPENHRIFLISTTIKEIALTGIEI
jgi:hypothetical protein